MSCPLASTYQFGCGGASSAMQYGGPVKPKRKATIAPALQLHSPKIQKDDPVYVTKKKATRKHKKAAVKKSPKGRKAPVRRAVGSRRSSTKKARW